MAGVNSKGRMGWIAAASVAVLALSACSEREVILQGERLPVRADLDASSASLDSVAKGLRGSAPISLPAAVKNAEWAQRGGNAQHNAPHAALSSAPKLVWQTNIGAGSSKRERIAAAPVVAGGRVFTLDAAQKLSAVSTGGGLLWQVSLAPLGDRGGQISGGGLAAEGGKIYATTGFGEVIALEAASGAVIWRQKLDSSAQGAPAVANGVVYATARDGAAWAIDAATGKVIWQVIGTPGTTGFVGTSAPTVAGSTVIFPSGSGNLTAVLKVGGGTKVWTESLAGRRLGRAYATISDVTGDAALSGATLYTGTAAGRTVALDVGSGEKKWSADEGAIGPLAIAGGSVFLVNDQARLIRLDAASGEKIFDVEMPYFEAAKAKKHKAIYAYYGPVLAGGRLWVASSEGILRGFSPIDGSLVATAAIPGGAATQPAVAAGTLYVVSKNGQLLAFR